MSKDGSASEGERSIEVIRKNQLQSSLAIFSVQSLWPDLVHEGNIEHINGCFRPVPNVCCDIMLKVRRNKPHYPDDAISHVEGLTAFCIDKFDTNIEISDFAHKLKMSTIDRTCVMSVDDENDSDSDEDNARDNLMEVPLFDDDEVEEDADIDMHSTHRLVSIPFIFHSKQRKSSAKKLLGFTKRASNYNLLFCNCVKINKFLNSIIFEKINFNSIFFYEL